MSIESKAKHDAQKGFTLIELSIVLVIIGLIVGGILVGQDLIKAAEIRATVAQIEKYNSAVNTFRSKYNGIPGDIPVATAGAFGLFTETTLGGTAGHGDGNGLIEGGSAGATVGIGETLSFWRHLSDANLVDGQLGASGNSLLVVTDGTLTGNVTSINESLPISKTTPANAFVAYSNQGLNYYQLLPVSAITDGTGAYTLGSTGLTPTQSYNMDIKLDDGMPITGIVQAKAITAVNTAPTAQVASTANTCVQGDTAGTNTADTYNRSRTSGGDDPSCSVRFRFN